MSAQMGKQIHRDVKRFPMASAALKTALTNVRVFDGQRLTDPTTVVIDDGTIGTDADGARPLDAGGAVLPPGLIDAHVHLHGPEFLDRLAARGVTTALDMANSPEQLAMLRDVPGTTSVRSAGTPVIGPGGPHSRMPLRPRRTTRQISGDPARDGFPAVMTGAHRPAHSQRG
ncbi:hydrolase [Streptomyces sp. 769]|nr:hydrolase [Streptomyces sp. 769]